MIQSIPKMRAPEAAAYIGLSTSTLAKMRLRGDGPQFIKAGRRVVLYDLHDIDEWLASRRRSSTSDVGQSEIKTAPQGIGPETARDRGE